MNAETLRSSGEKLRTVLLVTSASAAIIGLASEKLRNKAPEQEKRKPVDYSRYSLDAGTSGTIYQTPYDS